MTSNPQIADAWRPALQTGAAAGIAWWIAGTVVGHPAPLSAPIVAAVSIGAVTRARLRRFAEVVVGVSIGIALATLVIAEFGRAALPLAFIVTAAMLAARAVRGGELLALQSAVTSILVFAAAADSADAAGTRFIDALIGGGTAAAVSLLVLPPDPRRLIAPRVHSLLTELHSVLAEIATALRLRDADRAEQALERARALDGPVAELHAARSVALEVARFVPARRRSLADVRLAEARAPHLDHAVRHTRVLARATLTAVLADDPGIHECAAVCDELASAVDRLGADWSQRGQSSTAGELADHAAYLADGIQQQRLAPSLQAAAAAARGVGQDLSFAATTTTPRNHNDH